MIRSAIFSDDRKQRYFLFRSWQGLITNGAAMVHFHMLNPSVADGEQDDATVRKCVGFAKRWGFLSLVVTNLIPDVSTSPFQLPAWRGLNLKNHEYVKEWTSKASLNIAAWGAPPAGLDQLVGISEHVHFLKEQTAAPFFCIGTTAKGWPLHPSRARYTPAPLPYWER